MRLDKFLVHMQVGSRTQVKTLVKAKRIHVNGVLAKKADMSIDEYQDHITFDEKHLIYQEFVYLMLNKPQDVISATQDNHHRTVLDLIKHPAKKLFPVGRLDIDTTGLLLITNDGQLAHELLSPKKHVDKLYQVETQLPLTVETIEQFEKGIVLEDGFICQSAKLEILDRHHALVTIKEGKFHQIKRMFLACNNRVVALKRLQMGTLKLDEKLRLGEYRELLPDEIEQLLKFK